MCHMQRIPMVTGIVTMIVHVRYAAIIKVIDYKMVPGYKQVTVSYKQLSISYKEIAVYFSHCMESVINVRENKLLYFYYKLTYSSANSQLLWYHRLLLQVTSEDKVLADSHYLLFYERQNLVHEKFYSKVTKGAKSDYDSGSEEGTDDDKMCFAMTCFC